MKKYDIGLLILTIIVVVTVAATFMVSVNPLEKQKQARDKQRTQHVEQIKGNVESYYQRYKKLPKALVELRVSSPFLDPSTNKPYEYTKKTESAYEVCASFETDNRQEKPRTYGYPTDTTRNNYTYHSNGRNCTIFTLSEYQSLPVYTPTPTQSSATQYATLSYENLGVTATCKPYTKAYSGAGYVKESDPAFIGIVSQQNKTADQFEIVVNEANTYKTVNKKVKVTGQTKYYDKNCVVIDFSKIQASYSVIVYAPSLTPDGTRQAAYVQLAQALLPQFQ